MTLPLATYRLQFRNGMTFDRAVDLVPYLKRLGVSHLYASPIFTATRGSTHGYDVCNHLELDPVLGGEAGFDRLSEALKRAGLGLILDIVPNHMAASTENDWWRSLIEWGARSPHDRHFDIDRDERLTLPILGSPYGEALAKREFTIRLDARLGKLVFAYFDHALPLDPATYGAILGQTDEPLAQRIAACATAAEPADERRMQDEIRGLLADATAARRLDEALARLSNNENFVDRAHRAQPWALLFWKEARRHLSYRRFFEITGLVGIRVEDEQVFTDVHRLILDLVRSGRADGLRVDHVDGLADPKGYLDRLRGEIGPDVHLTVEKILGEGETLPADWPIAGTTGYEFVGAMAEIFVDAGHSQALDWCYAAAVDPPPDVEAEKRRAKRLMVERNFETETAKLVRIATAAAADLGLALARDDLDAAIAGLIVDFPVYRTYGTRKGMPARDRRLLDHIAARTRTEPGVDAGALDFVLRLLTGDVPAHAGAAAVFRTRFQQLTGPVTAKAVEDTLFYRSNRFIALNEVGSDPGFAYGSLARFHDAMAERARRQPRGLSTTATHDTKRGEDARARLYALGEAPDVWGAAVDRWRGMHAALVRRLPGGPAPEPETEWLLYQALAGIWPKGAEAAGPDTFESLRERFIVYVEKALREAKRRTSWEEVDDAYENAVKTYAGRLLSHANRLFIDDFAATLAPFVAAGTLNSLAQTLIKMTAPGIPDIYQGAELQDLSLVDPDNRRPVDGALLSRSLDAGATPAEGAVPGIDFKQHLVARCLRLRRARPALFDRGCYVPLEVSGPGRDHIVAFARILDDEAVVVVAPRLNFPLVAKGEFRFAAETVIDLPALCRQGELTDVLTERRYDGTGHLDAAALMHGCPLALLATIGDGVGSEPW